MTYQYAKSLQQRLSSLKYGEPEDLKTLLNVYSQISTVSSFVAEHTPPQSGLLQNGEDYMSEAKMELEYEVAHQKQPKKAFSHGRKVFQDYLNEYLKRGTEFKLWEQAEMQSA